MDERFSRAEALLSESGIARLADAHVCVLGAGGVGCACIEALVRAGVGHVTVVDGDRYSLTNCNRQLYATEDTLGAYKAEVACARARRISAAISATPVSAFYRAGEAFDLSGFDFIADCIDDVAAKVDLVCRAKEAGVPIVSAMGAAGKLDPARFQVCDLAKTHTDPLAKKLRRLLGERGIRHLDVVFSPEAPRAVARPMPSVSFVPPVAGFVMAGHIVRTLLHLSL